MLRTSLKFVAVTIAALAAALAPTARAQSFADGFEDGEPSNYWQVSEAVPALSIGEANGRLEFTATADPAQSSKKFAGYLSANWHMRTSANIFARVTVHDEVAGVSSASGSMQSLAFGFFKVGDTPDSNGFPGTSKFMEVGARRVTPNGANNSAVYRWIDYMKYTSSGESEIAVSRYAFPDDPTVFYSSSSGLYAFNFPYTQQVYMRYTTNDDTLSISLFSYNGPYIVQIGNFTNGQRYPVGIALGGYTKLQSDLTSGKAWYDNLYVDSATIDAAAPNFAASDGTYGNKIVLTWTAAPGATGYKVFRTPKSGGDTVELASGLSATALSYEDTTADRLVEYTYALQTLTSPSGDTEYQATDTGWRNVDVPTGVVASDSLYSDKILVQWNAVDGAIGYGVYRAVGTATPTLVGQTETGVTEYADTTAAIGTTYSYTVKAVSALGSTGASTADNGTRAPYPPTNVAAGDGSFPQKVRVTWTAVPGATGYRVYRRVDGGTATLLANVNGGSTSFYDDTTATALTTYLYSMSSMVSSTESAVSAEDSGWRNIAAPTLTAGLGTSATGINLSWTAVQGATGYTVLRTLISGAGTPIATNIAGTTYADTDVDPLVVYTYTVQAEHALGLSAASTGVLGWENLPAPTGVAASDGEFSNRVAVSWNAVSGAGGYTVWRKVATATTAPTQIGSAAAGALSYSDTSAAIGTNYLYSVKATHLLGSTALSEADGGWRSTVAPTTTAATDGTYPDKVRVTWSSVSGATGYKVFRAENGGEAALLATLSGAGTVAFDDTTATAATSYSYFVRSRSAAGDSPAGPTDTGWRNLPTPTGVAASDGTFDDRVRVTWAATPGAIGYKVFRKLGTAAAVELGSVGESTTEFDDATAQIAKSYAYSVKAISDLGDSLMSTTDAGIRAPAAPLNVSATDGTLTTGSRVSWSLSTGATGYKVYRRTEGGVAAFLKSVGSTATSYEDKSAVALTTYIYSVVATATGVTSAASDEDSGWRNIGAPTATASLGTSATAVNVSWSVVAGATGYRVQRAVSGGAFETLDDLGTVTTYADATADPVVAYQYRVLTLHTQGASNPGSAVTGWRNIVGPSPITATDGEFSTKVAVAWPAISGATGYTVWRKLTTSTAAATQIANIIDPAQLAYDDTTAAIGKDYTYSVRSKHALGQSLSGTTDAGWRNTAAPATVSATDGAYTDKIRVTWSASTAATGFRIYRRQGSDTPVQVGSTASAGARTFDDTTANPAESYDYFISAVVNTLGISAQSAPNSGWRKVAAPALVAASDGTYTDRVRVTWQPVAGATGYKVYRRVGSGATVEIANLADPAADSFDDQTVGPVTLGTYSVIAQSALGPSATSLTNTGWCNLDAPTGVAATDGSFTTKVVVSWQAVTGATGYRVYRSVNGAAATQIGTANATTFLFNDTTVAAGTVATYTVAGSSALGLTAQSASDTGFRAMGFAGGGGDEGDGTGGDIARNPGDETIGDGSAGHGSTGTGSGESSDDSDAGDSSDDGSSDPDSGTPAVPTCDEAVARIAAQVAALEADGSESALALADLLAALVEPTDGAPARACAILAGDVDGDGAITGADLVAFLAACAAEDLVLADVNRDGAIDLADLAIVERRIAESLES